MSQDSALPKTEHTQNLYLVALATYNEMENLPGLVAEIHRQVPEANVLVVDDNSPDGTGQWCQDFESKSSWFHSVHRVGKLGLGSAIVEAIQWGQQHGYRYLITLDADWSHPPKTLPEMIAAAAKAPIVIGSRYCPGGRIVGWSWKRRWASRVNNWLSHRLIGIPSRDNSGNFRVYDLELISQLNLKELRCEGYAFLEEILWMLHCHEAEFAEVPITFTNRVAGDSKINLSEVGGKLATLARLMLQRVFKRR